MRKICGFIILLALLSGCVTGPDYIGPTATPGIYHEVERGETLWYISKIYDVDLKKIAGANRLPDASKIEIGQLIFIPRTSKSAVKEKRPVVRLEGFIWPVKGTVVSYFGATSNMAKNKGIDIAARQGAAVLASRGGKVTFTSERLKGYGKTVIIDHLDGFETVYAYNTQNLVDTNQRVDQGDVIAKTGKTGRADRPTLHFEIRRKHKPQNPFYYLP